MIHTIQTYIGDTLRYATRVSVFCCQSPEDDDDDSWLACWAHSDRLTVAFARRF
jgi:hypothetical protein